MKSDVYFVKSSGNDLRHRRDALLKLLNALGPDMPYKKDELLPVKITIGDSECVYHLDPELVKIVISTLKDKKAKPFLFDTNVMYKGSRQNAVDHLTLAVNKKFSHSRIGAPFIIADGLLGLDGNTYKLDSKYIKQVKLPSFIGMTDSLVVLSHVTSHILSGFAASIKNIAMGMVSKATKQVEHSSLKPDVIEKKCTSCGCCIKICPVDAIKASGDQKKAKIDRSICVGCGECLSACKFDAIGINWQEDVDVFIKRISEVTKFILSKFKNTLFINFAYDITRECDCISTKNEKIISEDIGIIASKDILSVEKATIDLMNKNEDKIFKERAEDSYKEILEYSNKIGLGNLDYNLIEL
ncbi:MAG: DUF362 domain-containing protein [Candidatus Omnitrophota bacterium]